MRIGYAGYVGKEKENVESAKITASNLGPADTFRGTTGGTAPASECRPYRAA
jgi:hypothetical protein